MPYEPFRVSPAQDAELDALIALARPGAVFALDVDGCLTDTRWRQLHILQAWAEATGNFAVATVRPEHFSDRNLVRTLENAGIDPDRAAAWQSQLRPFWGDRFFDDHHVEFDAPMPGAARFLAALHDAGAVLVYLTGRHTSMRPAGERMFRRHGFPLGRRAWFMDKPDPQVEDHVHKLACYDALGRLGDVVAAMDNEPINVNQFADHFPRARVVFVATDCSDRGIVPHAHFGVVHGFLRTSDLVLR